jgi:hypothetical protein
MQGGVIMTLTSTPIRAVSATAAIVKLEELTNSHSSKAEGQRRQLTHPCSWCGDGDWKCDASELSMHWHAVPNSQQVV